ncbi:MAG: formate dehydrogenase accessory sulfurtransferase FdhD, partial [Rudaea sp.]
MEPDDRSQYGDGITSRCVLRVRGDSMGWERDQLAVEVPVALKVAGETALVMLATPSDLRDYALGFCLSEGIVADASQLRAVRMHERLEGIELDLDLTPDAARKLIERSRAMEGRSGCGWCGAASLEHVVSALEPVRAKVQLERAALRVALDALPALQPLNAACGAVHAAA